MVDAGPGRTVDFLSGLMSGGVVGTLTDAQLLEQFRARDGDDSQISFAALVDRHGPMVLRVARALVHDEHLAEDVFQASFLVLALKAERLRVGESLGPWLHEVARRIASSAAVSAARRRRHERRAAESSARGIVTPRADRDEVLHEEIGRLRDRYRQVILLCDLDGLTGEQAAVRLGWPLGTVWSRLARGRKLLRERLVRRGLSLTTLEVSPLAMLTARPIVPPELARCAVRAALSSVARRQPIGASMTIIALTHGALDIMKMHHIRKLLVAALVPLAVAVTYLAWAPGATSQAPAARGKAAAKIDPRIRPLLGTWRGRLEGGPDPGALMWIRLLSSDPAIAKGLGFEAPFVCTFTDGDLSQRAPKPRALLFVDPRPSPPHITLQPLGYHAGDSDHLDGSPAVYQVVGNLLKFHQPGRIGGRRPATLEPTNPDETYLRVYERVSEANGPDPIEEVHQEK